jgi:HTH-like domain/Integrase core domain
MKLYPFIEAEKVAARNVARACVLLKVSRSAYYTHRQGPSPREVADAELAAEIATVHIESKGRYGAPRVHAVLRRGGHRLGRKRVARLMAARGLAGGAPKRWKKTTVADPAAAARLDLIGRDFSVDAARINSRWCGDITYIPTWEGWLFLATVIDIDSRRVVGWATADHLRTELISDALSNAVATRDPSPGVIFHSDRGCQGGFNWLSQHLDRGGVDGQTSGMDAGFDRPVGDEVAGRPEASSGHPTPVLARDRHGGDQRGRRGRGGRVTGGGLPLVPARWRHASVQLGRARWPVSVVS